MDDLECANASPAEEDTRMHALFRGISVIPVLTIDRERDAVPLARALFEGGLPVIEVALRTPAATAAIGRRRRHVAARRRCRRGGARRRALSGEPGHHAGTRRLGTSHGVALSAR